MEHFTHKWNHFSYSRNYFHLVAHWGSVWACDQGPRFTHCYKYREEIRVYNKCVSFTYLCDNGDLDIPENNYKGTHSRHRRKFHRSGMAR